VIPKQNVSKTRDGEEPVTTSLIADEIRAALSAADDADATPAERAEMLMEIAMGLQQQPKSPDQLHSAVTLYDKALSVCPQDMGLLRARILARKATALQAIPEQGTAALEQARATFEESIPTLIDFGKPEELAEAEMNLGLVIQNLAGAGQARITDAISAYQRALRVFTKAKYPREFVILQSNLATAFLSMPMTDERGKMREALAVQAFEEGLKVVSLIDYPTEYAMLQNNLGNALQYVSSSHTLENNLRALDAYDEALKVRTRDTTPLEYANTISNKANCLWNLPDDPANPDAGNRANLTRANAYYREARAIFMDHGDLDKARIVAEAVDQSQREILMLPATNGHGGNQSRATGASKQ
jgi:tetratricopeptide (TPR) repeat protein